MLIFFFFTITKACIAFPARVGTVAVTGLSFRELSIGR
jgi:hypothetical protein